MTELGSIYNHNGKQSTASTQSRQIAEKFASAIGEFNWKVEYFKFCELLELEAGEYADEQYSTSSCYEVHIFGMLLEPTNDNSIK